MEKMLTSLTIYPVKGCKGIELDKVSVGPKGPGLDRRFVIADSEGRFLSQRQLPHMALIETRLEKEEIVLRFPDQKEIRFAIPTSGSEKEVTVWKDTCRAIDVGDEAAQILTAYLEKECRLYFMPDKTLRQVDLSYAKPNDIVGFADAYPFLLISEASLEDLNQRLEKPVLMNRFRPNLVVSGCKPFEEDTWKWIRIGKIPFKVAKPCSRCTVITIDQSTGEKEQEPFKTLSGYRMHNKKVMFGQNLIHSAQGELFLGDRLEVLE
jgi:uncharacterized protein